MELEYEQGRARSDLLVQLAHRAAIATGLITALAMGVAMKGGDARGVAIAAVVAADLAVLAGVIGLILAYRAGRPIFESIGVLFFTLIAAHLAVWTLISPASVAAFGAAVADYWNTFWSWVGHQLTPAKSS
jgi:hypothetical protein